MFNNLIEAITAQLPLSEEFEQLLEKVSSKPNLSYFEQNQTSKSDENDGKSRLPVEEMNKASLLRLLSTAARCPETNIHYEKCKNLISMANTSRSLPLILEQYDSFKFIVVAETIVALQTKDFAAIKDPEYQTNLVKAACSSPKYIRPIFCVALLQLIGFYNVYNAKKIGTVKVRPLPETAKKLLTKKIFSPILLGSFLDSDSSAIVTKILKQFDVFDIVLNKWIRPSKKLLQKDMMNVVRKEVFYFLACFLRLYLHSLMNQSPTTIVTRILPLMSEIVDYDKSSLKPLLKECNIFNSKTITDMKFFATLHFAASACNSEKNTLMILDIFTGCKNRSEPLLKNFFDALNDAHSEIISQKVDEYAISSLNLLKGFIKYLKGDYIEQIINLFNGSDIDDPMQSLVSFLWDFLTNNELAVPSSKVLKYITRLYPEIVLNYFNDPSEFRNIEIMMENNPSVGLSFIRIARDLVSFSFCHGKTEREIPQFAKYLVTDYLPNSFFKKFDTRSKRWAMLISILEIALDISYCDLKFCSSIQNDQSVSRCLISIVRQTAGIIETPPQIIHESENVRLDSDKLRIIIQFDLIALTLMIRLLSYNLLNEKELSYLATSFFSNNSEASSLFSTFISFLQLTHPLTSQLRYYAIQMIDIMCEIANRIPNISVDSFYPRESQSVLIESVKTNLFKSTDLTQTINELDFISHTLSSQLSFSYSFVRRLGSSFVAAATVSLENIASQFPSLFLSLSRLLSKMFQKLSLSSKAITKLTDNQSFSSSILAILEKKYKFDDNTDYYTILASKAELLNILILNGNDISKDLIDKLLSEVIQVLPRNFESLNIKFKLDMKRFINAKLHCNYGEKFYINIDLLERYLVNNSERALIISKAKEANIALSCIDACTQILSSIISFINFASNEKLIPSFDIVCKLIEPILKSDIYPDSTSDLVFQLLDMHISVQYQPISSLGSSFIYGITNFMRNRPLPSIFTISGKLISIYKKDQDVENIKDLELAFYWMFKTCIHYSHNHLSSDCALKCSCEIALKLVDKDNWITYIPINIDALIGYFFEFLNSPIGPTAIDLMTIILLNSKNALTFEQKGFFEKFILIDCNGNANSPLWPRIFYMMSSISISSNIAFNFLSTHLNKIVFFMNQIARETIKPIHLYRIQAAITSLLAAMAPNLKQFAQENPAQFDMIIEINSTKIRESLMFLRESPHLKLDGELYTPDSYNEKTCNLIILRNCLLFVNQLLDFPNGNPLILFNDTHITFPILDLMDKVAESLQALLSKDAKEFTKVCLQSFEFALRIFLQNWTSAIKNPSIRAQIIENRNSVLRSINSVQSSIKKFMIQDTENSIELFDAISSYLCSIL